MRVGLGFVRDWSEETAEHVVLERERRGPFRGLADLVRRAPPRLSREAIEHLVWVGGCDGFGLTRRELLWQVGLCLPPKHAGRPAGRVKRQLELGLDHPYERLRFGDLDGTERMLSEYQVLGFAASGHPFRLLRGALPPGVVSSAELGARESGTKIDVAGLVVARQRPQTAKGFIFVLMEDEAGMINVIVRPDVYERDRIAVRGEPFLWVAGKVQNDGGSINVIAERVEGLRVGEQGAGSSSFRSEASASGTGGRSPYAFLRAMRGVTPGSKDWG